MIAAWVFWIAVAFVYFRHLGQGSLEFWDEALTAERSREMLVTGDWLTPYSNRISNFNKPPVYYWLTAAAFAAFGQSEFTVRLWSVLFALACLGVVQVLAARAGRSPWAGLLAAVFLAANPHWINGTRQGMPDSGLLLGMLAGIYGLLHGRAPGRRVVGSAAALAFGCLVKNPLALLAAVVPFVQFRWIEKSGARAREALQAAGLAAVLVLGWYVIQFLRWGPIVLDQFLGYNILRRITEPIEGQEAGFFFYLETWWGGSAVSLFLFALPLAWFLARRREVLKPYLSLAALSLVLLLLISLAASKRGNYLLLVYPFAAIVSGGLWHDLLAAVRPASARLACAAAVVAISVAYLGARYKPVIDGCPRLKEAALQIKAAAGQGPVVVSVRVPADALMFYSGFVANTIWANSIGRDLRRFTREKERNHYIVSRRGETGKVIRVLEKRRRRWSQPSVWFQNDEYSIVLLPARAPAPTAP
ncbi:MAG: glycosyltransferase family 39 protein [Verrucomicrobiota bacterium]